LKILKTKSTPALSNYQSSALSGAAAEIKSKRQLRAEQADADLEFIQSINFAGRAGSPEKPKGKHNEAQPSQSQLERERR
jgi:hypothetical protein